MNTRLRVPALSHALSLALAGVVTVLVLGSVDFLATQPQQEALLARASQPAATPAVVRTAADAPAQAVDANATTAAASS